MSRGGSGGASRPAARSTANAPSRPAEEPTPEEPGFGTGFEVEPTFAEGPPSFSDGATPLILSDPPPRGEPPPAVAKAGRRATPTPTRARSAAKTPPPRVPDPRPNLEFRDADTDHDDRLRHLDGDAEATLIPAAEADAPLEATVMRRELLPSEPDPDPSGAVMAPTFVRAPSGASQTVLSPAVTPAATTPQVTASTLERVDPTALRAPSGAAAPIPEWVDGAEPIGRIFGLYRVIEVVPLPIGFPGVIYAASHTSLQTRHWVWLDPRPIRPGDRFLHRASVFARSQHPHVLAIVDFGQTPDGLRFVVTEEPANPRPLADRLQPRIPLANVAWLAWPIAHALAEAHAQGHGGGALGLDQIWMVDSPTGEIVKVLGFGFGELFEGAASRPEDEVRAFGHLLYALIVGRAPQAPLGDVSAPWARALVAMTDRLVGAPTLDVPAAAVAESLAQICSQAGPPSGGRSSALGLWLALAGVAIALGIAGVLALT